MIYLDNAATSYPKPDCVVQAINRCFKERGANPGRGSHQMALAAGREIFEAREALASLIGVSDSTNIVFTMNCTEALNLALKGLLKGGDHAITTSVEHNSVARPLKSLESAGVFTTKIACGRDGALPPAKVEEAIKPETKLIAVTGASNVTGSLMPIGELSEIARRQGLLLLVDGAQIAGHRPIDVEGLGIHLFAFPGHKGLLGPQGTGGLYIHPGLELAELLQGGTGANSRGADQPKERPERYESGTPNTPGIAGLGAAASFLAEVGLDEVEARERDLTQRLLVGLARMEGVILYGPAVGEERAAVVSFNIEGVDADQVAFILDQTFGIASRSGLHCSPDAHATMGTLEMGAVRLSPGFHNEAVEIDRTLEAIEAIVKEYSPVR